MIIKRLISGMQTGADQGGLIAAKKAGIPTGGWATKGWRTEDGPNPELGNMYGLVEHESPDYAKRTAANVHDSNGTIRFAYAFGTAGERCTLKNIRWYNKPYFDVKVLEPPPPEEVAQWIVANNIEVLNVAGNRESSWPGMEKFVVEYLGKVFDLLK